MNKRILLVLFVTALFWLTQTQLSNASMVKGMTVEEMTDAAEIILQGKVTSVRSEWNHDHTQIYTFIKVAVTEYIKGGSNENEYTLRILGGTVGDTTLYVVGVPQFRVHEELLLFIRPGLVPVVGMFQGKFIIETDPKTGRKVLKDQKIYLDDFIDGIKTFLKEKGGGKKPKSLNFNLENTLEKHPGPFRILGPNPGAGGFYVQQLNPTDMSPFVHWDLREFSSCIVPWSLTDNTPDVDGDGLRGAADPAEQLAVFGVISDAFEAWEDVTPSVIEFVDGACLGAVAGRRAIRLDDHNLLDWREDAPGDDIQEVAVGGGVAPGGVVVAPGANLELESQPRGDDQITDCIVDGGNGVANTAAAGDDIQVVAVDGAVAPGGVIILPGLNGVINTVPAGDDVLSDCITDGGNGTAETAANNMGTVDGYLALTGIFINNRSGAIIESDIWFNDDLTWRIVAHGVVPPAGTNDLQTVATHEIGHFLGIAHPIDADDIQVVPVGGGVAPGGIVVAPGPDGILATNPQGDDIIVGGNIVDGGNGIAETQANNGAVMNPAPSPIMNPLYCNTWASNHLLSADDCDACNFLYTPDLGDALDPFTAFNQYPSHVHGGPGRILSGVPLLTPAAGAEHLFGYYAHPDSPYPVDHDGDGQPDYQYEWLGERIDDHWLECHSRQVDLDFFDDGVTFAGPFIPGVPTLVEIEIRTNGLAGRYVAANPNQVLYLRGWFDWNANGIWAPAPAPGGELELWWEGGPGFTNAISPNWSRIFYNPNGRDIELDFDVTPPVVPDILWCRFRLDYGEDCGAAGNIDGTLGDSEGAAQFGEVEDYQWPPCGDCSRDGVIELGDVLYLISYLYKGGLPPDPLCIGDVSCDGIVDLGDVLYEISYLYKSGLPPCQECCSDTTAMGKFPGQNIERILPQKRPIPHKPPQTPRGLKWIE